MAVISPLQPLRDYLALADQIIKVDQKEIDPTAMGRQLDELHRQARLNHRQRKPKPSERRRTDCRTPSDQQGYDEIDSIDLPPPAPWPVLRTEAMRGIVGEIVSTIAPESEADPVGLQIQLLAAVGNAVGRAAHVRVEGDIHFCNLFAINVGKSGHGRKGTSWGRVRQMMEISDPDWLKGCIASGMSSGEGLIYRVRDSRVAENADGEPDIVDAGIQDKRLLAIETEFAGEARAEQ